VSGPLGELAAGLAELAGVVDAHHQRLERMERQQRRTMRPRRGRPRRASPARAGAKLAAARARRPDRRAAPWNRWETDPATRGAFTVELAAWVDGWLRPTYPSEAIGPSWASQPAIAEELGALYVAWGAAYRGRRSPSLEPVYFHDALARVLARLREWRAEHHRRSGTGHRPAARWDGGGP